MPRHSRFFKPEIWGIINLTADSFSDGGKYLDLESAFKHARFLIESGADVLDIGAESTRPGSMGIAPARQLELLLPLICRLKKDAACAEIPLSVDTQSAIVAEQCLQAGVSTINDISAMRADPRMVEVIAKAEGRIVLMHMQGTPADMQNNPIYCDVLEELNAFFCERIDFALRNRIDRSRIVLDPGIGFGKSLEHNCTLLQNLETFTRHELPIMVGVSRKKFLGTLSDLEQPADRDGVSVVAGIHCLLAGASILRVHDVKAHREAFKVWSVLQRD